MSSTDVPPQRAGTRLSVSALLVAAGMLLSRISGFARTTLFSFIFGVESVAADAFNSALRIPNFLQNLLGEGVLSASLIPVYASLLHKVHQARADQVARAVLAVLAFITALVVAGGLLGAPQLVTLISPGFHGEKRELTIHLVQILFPGIGLLVMSAWCLAVLNSHHRFFLSYVAPVFWNAALIATIVIYRHSDLNHLVVQLAWAAVLGATLQLAVQVIPVWRIMSAHWNQAADDVWPHVRQVLTVSLPVIFTRGVVQVSAIIDSTIASYLPGEGAVTALAYVQQLYAMPISLFGMAISSAALPSMSTAMAGRDPDVLRNQLYRSQRMIVVLVIPSMFVFVAFGDVMIGMLLQHGRFMRTDTLYVWGILAGSAVGLLSTTVGRLYSSAFYALGDTRTPTRFAVARVVLVAGLGYLLAIKLPPMIGLEQRWGAAGLTVSAGLAGWVEFALLRASLARRIQPIPLGVWFQVRSWLAASAATAATTGLRWIIPPDQLILRGVVLLGVFGISYLVIAHLFGILSLSDILRQVFRRGKGGGRRQ